MATEKSVATVKPIKPAPPARNAAPASSGSSNRNSLLPRASKYLHEVRAELRKTTWPSKAELIAQTKVVLGMLVAIGVFIAVWDFLLGQIFNAILWVIGVRHG